MSLPFIKVRTDEWLQEAALVTWSPSNRAPSMWVDLDLAVLISTGRIKNLSVRKLAERWGWPKSTVARRLANGVGQIWDSSGTVAGQDRDTQRPTASVSSKSRGTVAGQDRDNSGTRARSSLEREEEEGREERVSAKADEALPPAAEPPADSAPPPAPKPEPKPKPAKVLEAENGLQRLAGVREALHTQATGRQTRGRWGTGKAGAKLVRQVRAYLDEIKESELGEPLDVLETVARWVYLGPDDFFRRRPDPLGSMLGGTPTTRLGRAVDALDWAAGSPSHPAKPRPQARGKPTQASFLERIQAMRQQQPAARRVVNDEPPPPDDPFADHCHFDHPAPGSPQ